MAKTYRINECFYSLQGEGVRAGTPNIFIRFSGCNMECAMAPGPKSPGGFDCDTEFASGRNVTLDELYDWVWRSHSITLGCKTGERQFNCDWLILTGGEPGLQVDTEFIQYFHKQEFKLAIETNGTIELPAGLNWITLSPKVAEHAIKQRTAHEVKYVRGYGQGIPKPWVTADHLLISPAFDGMQVHPDTLKWCTRLCLENPPWRLSLQTHKILGVR